MDEDSGWMGAIVFFGVWIGCTVGFGPLGFMLGWMPALILAMFWPLIAALGCVVIVVIVILVILIAILLLFPSRQVPPSWPTLTVLLDGAYSLCE